MKRKRENPPAKPPPRLAPGKRRRDEPIRITNEDPHHHCQGHRLAIVIGPKTDPNINGALAWIHGLGNVQHKLLFDTLIDWQPGFAEPWVPNATTWVKRTNTTANPLQEIMTGYQCCCHWDEVILVCHGGQKKIWYVLLRYLPRLLGDRPVRKFVLWMCGSAQEFCQLQPHSYRGYGEDGKLDPTSTAPVNLFEQICYWLRPKSCNVDVRCGCTHDHCKAYNADGRRTPRHCPDGIEPVKLVCAAWCDVRMPDKTFRQKPARLGLWLNPATNRYELKSPDGKVREVNIAADGNVTTEAPATSGDVFAGTRLTANPGLQPLASDNTGGAINTAARMMPTKIEQPAADPTPAYDGPKRCSEPWHEGCQPDGI